MYVNPYVDNILPTTLKPHMVRHHLVPQQAPLLHPRRTFMQARAILRSILNAHHIATRVRTIVVTTMEDFKTSTVMAEAATAAVVEISFRTRFGRQEHLHQDLAVVNQTTLEALLLNITLSKHSIHAIQS